MVLCSRFPGLAASVALCAGLSFCRGSLAQDKNALAAAPLPADRSAPQNEGGAKAAPVPPGSESRAAVLLEPHPDRPQVRL
ncbi:MAG: hypothetical protein ABSE73_16475, partial [Planctomycetota bacterium]